MQGNAMMAEDDKRLVRQEEAGCSSRLPSYLPHFECKSSRQRDHHLGYLSIWGFLITLYSPDAWLSEQAVRTPDSIGVVLGYLGT